MQRVTYSLHHLRSPLTCYGAAVLLTLLALLLRLLLAPLLGDRALLLLFFVPVVLSAWYGGFGPGLLAIALSVLAGAYFILPPPYAFLTDRSNLVMVGLFVLQGLLLAGLSALIRTRTLALRVELTERRRVEAALRESEARYRSLIETSPDAIVLTDLNTTILFCNDQAARLYGCARVEELIGRRGVEFIAPEDRQHVSDSMQRTLAAGSISNIEYTLLKHDGTQFPAEVSASVIVDADGQPAAFLAVVRDISERKQAEQALRESEEQYRLLVESAKDYAILMLDPGGRVVSWNTGAERLLGYQDAEIIGQPISQLFTPEDIERGAPEHELRTAVAEGRAEDECWHVHKDGTRFWAAGVITAIHDEAGQLRGFAKVMHDMTARKQAEQALQRQALHDPLTDLPNRALFLDRLGHALAHTKRHPAEVFAVLFLDLDRFKQINDSLGHFVGDQLLIEVAQRFALCIRADDTVARLGGDEFAILLEGIQHISNAIQVVGRIQQALAAPFQLNGSEVMTSASIGIALSTREYERPEEVLRDADTALYRAKARGRAQYAIFDPVMHAQAIEHLQLETELRRAIEREELQLHYQPIISLTSGTISEVEALVRWQHPTRGLLPPAQFIPLAEETGLIVPLGEWVLRAACNQTNVWQAAGLPPLTMAINLSTHQCQHPEVLTAIADIVATTRLAPHYLKLELTEGSLIDIASAARTWLWDLHALGVQIALDDFGTGYSCLSYLKHLPVTTVKIDRAFVQNIPMSPNDAAIATAIIALAHSLNLRVVAEGVETDAQLGFFRTRQADAVQGYLFGRPLPAEPLTQLLQQARG